MAGYDRTASALTAALLAEGIAVDTTGDLDAVPEALQDDLAKGRTDRWNIVRTPAVPDHFPLLVLLRGAGFRVMKRAELLGELTQNTPLLAVAGTHGKTTTSTLLAHLLHHGGRPVEPSSVGSPRAWTPTCCSREAMRRILGWWWKPMNSTGVS